ncbi:hypothetical protein SCYAM73S_00878 [Streptomyces cyaneofuscatus]
MKRYTDVVFRNWTGWSREDIAQVRHDWMNGTRSGEVKGYDGPPIPARCCLRCR